MELVSLFNIILLLSASALCIALIFYLGRITKSIKSIEEDIKNLSSEVEPLLDVSISLSEKLSDISDEAKSQLNTSKEIITQVKDRVNIILDWEKKIRGGIEVSAIDIIKNLSAVTNGLNAFWSAYKKKNKKI